MSYRLARFLIFFLCQLYELMWINSFSIFFNLHFKVSVVIVFRTKSNLNTKQTTMFIRIYNSKNFNFLPVCITIYIILRLRCFPSSILCCFIYAFKISTKKKVLVSKEVLFPKKNSFLLWHIQNRIFKVKGGKRNQLQH